jgi:hypothetical protein
MTVDRLAKAKYSERARLRKEAVNAARQYERCLANRAVAATAAFEAHRAGCEADYRANRDRYRALGPDQKHAFDQLVASILSAADDTPDNRALVDGILYLIPNRKDMFRIVLAELEDWGHRKVAIKKVKPPTENGGNAAPGG